MQLSRAAWLGGVLALAGCGPASPPVGTGARAAVVAYYEALMERDWSRAYAALHPDVRNQWSESEFAVRARHYYERLGFVPEKLQVRSCEEQGGRGVAHVVLVGHTAARPQRSRQARDAVILQTADDEWGIVLPRDFGRDR